MSRLLQGSHTVRRLRFVTTWTIIPSTNVIKIEDKKTSRGYVDIRVCKQTPYEFVEIDSSTELAKEGLKIMYYKDNAVLDATELVLKSNEVYTFDDGEILSLDNEIFIEVEETPIDISNVKKSITFVLVDANVTNVTDADIKCAAEITVINPDYILSIELDNNIICINTNAEGTEVLLSKEYLVNGRVKYGGKYISLSKVNIEITNPVGNNNVAFLESLESDDSFCISLNVTAGLFVNVPKYIELKASLIENSEYDAVSRINIQGIQRGKAGPMGDIGPMVYPSGTFIEGLNYSQLLDDKTNKVLGTVMVFDGVEDYYILKVKNSEGKKLSDSTIWQKMARYEAIYTKILMANFAQLASAVFYGKYMFSEYGVWTASNELSKYDAEGVKGNIFNIDDKGVPSLKGDFRPQLFLDFEKGGAALGKLSEMFVDFPLYKRGIFEDDKFNFIHYMDLNSSHNVNIYPRSINDSYHGHIEVCGAVVLPNGAKGGEWNEDGTHATIVYQLEPNRIDSVASYTPSQHPFVIVCADSLIFSNNKFNNNIKTNCFIWKGRPCKWIMLSHGQSLKLRSVKQCTEVIKDGKTEISYEGVNWIVDNASDFEPINLEVWLQKSSINELGDIETIEYANTSYDKPTDTNQTTLIALGGGIQLEDKVISNNIYVRQNESVYNNSSIFIDLGDGIEYNIGAGASNKTLKYIKVGLKGKIN